MFYQTIPWLRFENERFFSSNAVNWMKKRYFWMGTNYRSSRSQKAVMPARLRALRIPEIMALAMQLAAAWPSSLNAWA
jgi:hypothetical protein